MSKDEPDIIGDITDIEVIAVGASIRSLAALIKEHGGNRWRKLKGKAYVLDEEGNVVLAEVHWYECHGIGRRQIKVKKEVE